MAATIIGDLSEEVATWAPVDGSRVFWPSVENMPRTTMRKITPEKATIANRLIEPIILPIQFLISRYF
jgi:hypothetical protein